MICESEVVDGQVMRTTIGVAEAAVRIATSGESAKRKVRISMSQVNGEPVSSDQVVFEEVDPLFAPFQLQGENCEKFPQFNHAMRLDAEIPEGHIATVMARDQGIMDLLTSNPETYTEFYQGKASSGCAAAIRFDVNIPEGGDQLAFEHTIRIEGSDDEESETAALSVSWDDGEHVITSSADWALNFELRTSSVVKCGDNGTVVGSLEVNLPRFTFEVSRAAVKDCRFIFIDYHVKPGGSRVPV